MNLKKKTLYEILLKSCTADIITRILFFLPKRPVVVNDSPFGDFEAHKSSIFVRITE